MKKLILLLTVIFSFSPAYSSDSKVASIISIYVQPDKYDYFKNRISNTKKGNSEYGIVESYWFIPERENKKQPFKHMILWENENFLESYISKYKGHKTQGNDYRYRESIFEVYEYIKNND